MAITLEQYRATEHLRNVAFLKLHPLRNPYTGRINPAPTIDHEAS